MTAPPKTYQGTMLYPEQSAYAQAIFPLVQFKHLLQGLYRILFKVTWRELQQTPVTVEDTSTNPIAILLFLGLCLVSFWFQQVARVLLLTFLVTWLIDNGLSQRALRRGDYVRRIYLRRIHHDQLRWQWTRPKRSPLIAEFPVSAVQHLEVQPHFITGGAFKNPVGWVWQGQLRLADNSHWIVEEDANLDIVLQAIVKIKPFLPPVPVLFPFADGWGNAFFAPLQEQEHLPPRQPRRVVDIPNNAHSLTVSSHWQWQHSGQLIRQLQQESGFAIFVVVLMALMPKVGAVLHNLFIQQTPTGLVLSLGPLTPWQIGQLLIPVLIITLALLFRAWRSSRRKTCRVDAYFVRAMRANQTVGNLATHEVQSVFVQDITAPMVVICSAMKALTLGPFPNRLDALAFAEQTWQAIQHYQQKAASP